MTRCFVLRCSRARRSRTGEWSRGPLRRMQNEMRTPSLTRLPLSSGYGRRERFETTRREVERSSFLGAHVRRHQYLHHFDSVGESELACLAARKRANKMPVLRLISVGGCLFCNDWHQSHFGILLLDKIFAGFSFNLPTEEELETAVERIPGHRVLRSEQLGGQSQSGADEAPRRRNFADHAVTIIRFILDRRARKILRWSLSVIDCFAHRGRQPLGILGTAPLQRRDVRADSHRTDRRTRVAGTGEQIPYYLDRMTHHVVQHTTTLKRAQPEPRHMRPAVFFSCASEIRSAGQRRAACPDKLLTPCHLGCKKLVLQIARVEPHARGQTCDLLCLSYIAAKRLFARDSLELRAIPDRGDNLFDVADAGVIRSAQPDGVDVAIAHHLADGFVRARVSY